MAELVGTVLLCIKELLLIWVGMLKTLGMHGDSILLYVYPMLGIYADIIFQNT